MVPIAEKRIFKYTLLSSLSVVTLDNILRIPIMDSVFRILISHLFASENDDFVESLLFAWMTFS